MGFITIHHPHLGGFTKNGGFFPQTCEASLRSTWNLKHPFINGCFNWMIPNLYIGNGCFTKHPFKTGCLGFRVDTSWV